MVSKPGYNPLTIVISLRSVGYIQAYYPLFKYPIAPLSTVIWDILAPRSSGGPRPGAEERHLVGPGVPVLPLVAKNAHPLLTWLWVKTLYPW